MRYRIDAPPARRAAAEPGTRSLIGAVGRKVLKLLVYPVTDRSSRDLGVLRRAVGGEAPPVPAARLLAGDYAQPGGRQIEGGDAARLTAGRALLFVHGTFSTAHGGFGDVPPALMQELHARYGGRVVAFDHHTLSHDPRRNVEQLLQRLPAGAELDVVCHQPAGWCRACSPSARAGSGSPPTRCGCGAWCSWRAERGDAARRPGAHGALPRPHDDRAQPLPRARGDRRAGGILTAVKVIGTARSRRSTGWRR
jgi:hypothetical protein